MFRPLLWNTTNLIFFCSIMRLSKLVTLLVVLLLDVSHCFVVQKCIKSFNYYTGVQCGVVETINYASLDGACYCNNGNWYK